MKKYLFIVAAAALFAACSHEAETPEIALDNNAISFSAYTKTATTRGTVVINDSITKVNGKGIGVFAFYQPATNGVKGANYTTIKYPTPDFMYNQKVYVQTDENKWTYAPVKYWPNNKNDMLSFFAYAPYEGTKTWEDLGIKTDATGNTITKTFDIYNEVENQLDYLFAEPTVNMPKPSETIDDAGLGTGISGESSTDVVRFAFTHVTSKINIFVGVETDNVTSITPAGTPHAWTDANTTIEIKSIEFKGLASTLTWSKTGNAAAKWTAGGEQDFVVKPDTSTGINYGLIKNGWSAQWHRYLKGTQTGTPTASSDATQTTSENDEYMFIAPQKKDEIEDKEIVITYVVKTTDQNNTDNGSEITNTITKTWSNFRNTAIADNGFEANKQYNLFFLIGMQSVKVAATVTEWAANPTSHVVDVPTAAGN